MSSEASFDNFLHIFIFYCLLIPCTIMTGWDWWEVLKDSSIWFYPEALLQLGNGLPGWIAATWRQATWQEWTTWTASARKIRFFHLNNLTTGFEFCSGIVSSILEDWKESYLPNLLWGLISCTSSLTVRTSINMSIAASTLLPLGSMPHHSL